MTSTAPELTGLLVGRTALITGAKGAIGAATMAAFRAAGARVVGADLVQGDDDVVTCDVTNESEVERAFETAESETPITDVVHAAGILLIGGVREMAADDWRSMIEANLTGAFIVGRAAARRLGSDSTVTFIASQAGLRGARGWSAYSAAKAGVLRLAESLAQELAPDGIRVNAICPGSVETGMLARSIEVLAHQESVLPEEIRRRYESAIPLGRFAEPSEIASLCVVLASRLTSYVTGASIVADGGELSG